MRSVFVFLLDRAKERSTWLGFISVATGFGLSISPEQAEAIISLGLAVSGVVAVFTQG